MAMPRKGARAITVDGAPFRWKIRGRATGAQTLGEANLGVGIEAVTNESGVSTLVVDTSAVRGTASVTPAVVEAYIRQAMAKGWKPTPSGKPFVLVADEGMAAGRD